MWCPSHNGRFRIQKPSAEHRCPLSRVIPAGIDGDRGRCATHRFRSTPLIHTLRLAPSIQAPIVRAAICLASSLSSVNQPSARARRNRADHARQYPGRDHPWTKDSARVTADALDALGRTEEAMALRLNGLKRPPQGVHSTVCCNRQLIERPSTHVFRYCRSRARFANFSLRKTKFEKRIR